MKRMAFVLSLFVAMAGLLAPPAASAQEPREITVADQFGIGYLPLAVMRDQRLIEKRFAAAGLGEVKVNWANFGGGSAMNDALLSGRVDVGLAGLPALILLWDKTRGTQNEVRGISAICNTPLYLNTRSARINSLRDFGAGDRIALPSVEVSIQAIMLQMAAAKEFGIDNYSKLDPLTVSMKHPDATAALLSGRSEVTAHFTSPPYMFQQLEHPGVRRVMSSKEVVGDSSFIIAYATRKFHDSSPKAYAAVLGAVEDAIAFIRNDRNAAARIYVKAGKGKEGDIPALVKMLENPDLEYSAAPQGMMRYAEFMYRVGTIKTMPGSWKDFFFPNIHHLGGS